uniref:Uncharacterized protein n=1 Tax=viral metagenome TaxID=1070528 RepID=A0A6C0IRU9_9ZZZZ
MLVLNYIAIVIIIIVLGILYQKYLEKSSQTSEFDDYNEIKKYLLTESSLAKSKKPILWIHIPYEYNSRDWLSFGSRSSFELNQPYLYLTAKSIIKTCDESFTICFIDDKSFAKLIPNWKINMGQLADPTKTYIRQMAITKLLYNYGGLNVPISFLAFRDLIELYERGTNNDKMFVCENYDTNITSTNKLFYPSMNFMGAKKNNHQVKQLIDFMEKKISEDYTNELEFKGDFDRWVSKRVHQNKVTLISGTDVGTKTLNEEPVTIETLLGQDYVQFYGKMYGIWIPDKEILRRRYYEWFARMSPEQIFQSNFILAKYIVLALAPDSHNGVVEPLENADPKWISFWKTPITNNTMNIFGPMPMGLGNNVPRAKNSGSIE